MVTGVTDGYYDSLAISHAQNVVLHLKFTREANVSRKGTHLLPPINMSSIFPPVLSPPEIKQGKVKSKNGNGILNSVRQ